MITVQTTKKLFATLPLDSVGRLPGEQRCKQSLLTPLDQWHASFFLLQGDPAVIFMHDRTRFPVLVANVEYHGSALIEKRFHDVFINALVHLGAEENQLQRAWSYLQPMQFTPTTCRSVTGSMTHAAGELQRARTRFNQGNLWESQACAELADTPSLQRSEKTMRIPALEMLKLLGTEEKKAESQLIERFLKEQCHPTKNRNDLSLLLGVEKELKALNALDKSVTSITSAGSAPAMRARNQCDTKSADKSEINSNDGRSVPSDRKSGSNVVKFAPRARSGKDWSL